MQIFVITHHSYVIEIDRFDALILLLVVFQLHQIVHVSIARLILFFKAFFLCLIRVLNYY